MLISSKRQLHFGNALDFFGLSILIYWWISVEKLDLDWFLIYYIHRAAKKRRDNSRDKGFKKNAWNVGKINQVDIQASGQQQELKYFARTKSFASFYKLWNLFTFSTCKSSRICDIQACWFFYRLVSIFV